jgi:hypothetical protein
MAHAGNPWMIDAAEVVYKNLNVWVDVLSGRPGQKVSPARRAGLERRSTRGAASLVAINSLKINAAPAPARGRCGPSG